METTFKLQDFNGDLVVVGIGMDAERFEAIRAELPEDIRLRLIGWKKIGR